MNSEAIDLDVLLQDDRLVITRGKLVPDAYFPTATVTPKEVSFSGDGANTRGGKIEGDLPTDDLTFTTDEKLFKYDKASYPYAELILVKENFLLTLMARGYNLDGTYKDTPSTELTIIPYGTTPKVGLRWWKADPEAENGGVAVEVDGVVAACVTGLDNRLEEPPGLPQDPPPTPELTVNRIASQVITLRNVKLWRNLDPACTTMSPLLAGSTKRGGTDAWSAVSGNVRPIRAAGNGREGLEFPVLLPSWVVDRNPDAVRDYQTRFTLALADLGLAEGRDLTIFQGFDAHGIPPFSLRLRRVSGTTSLCADARSSELDPPRRTVVVAGCHPLDPARPVGVELRWWAGTVGTKAWGVTTGGLRLRVRVPSDEAPSGVWVLAGELDLANAGQRLDEVWLGTLDPDLGTPGALHVHGFESWQ